VAKKARPIVKNDGNVRWEVGRADSAQCHRKLEDCYDKP